MASTNLPASIASREPLPALIQIAAVPPLPRFRPAPVAAEALCLMHRPDIGVPQEEWRAMVGSRANALIIGGDDLVARLWTSLWPALAKPVCWTRSGALRLPRQAVPTLVLERTNELSQAEQQRLIEELDGEARGTRVLATASSSFFALVGQGAFLETLYYRLNSILLTLST